MTTDEGIESVTSSVTSHMRTAWGRSPVAHERYSAFCEGGGAIKGIGESFQANLFSGTAKHSIPVALSPWRNGLSPKLSLEHSSGSGNCVFGLDWHIGLPRIARKTEKGLPQRPPGALRWLLLVTGRALSHLWKEWDE
jgi:hypothetical protein